MRRASFGVHSALPLAIAHRRCPQAVLIPRDFELYQRASRKVMDMLRRFSDLVEVAGLDEAYLDLSESPAPKARARQLKREMRAETGLVCSVGWRPTSCSRRSPRISRSPTASACWSRTACSTPSATAPRP